MSTLIDSTPSNSARRLKISVPICYGPYQGSMMAGASVDISVGGLYLKSELPFDVDECLSLTISLPSMDVAFSCEAKVAWVNPAVATRKDEYPPGVGLKFTGLTFEDERPLCEFIERNKNNKFTDKVIPNKFLGKQDKCEHKDVCKFYDKYKSVTYGAQYYSFVQSYCNNVLFRLCKRRELKNVMSFEPPDNMSPTGHLIE